ncbi:ATP synthase subunit I [Coxiella-like endosymbiont]|uniref:ATP synthase subunit I n=1 Tax=Coxiella-like endosymbiont TaxID=1592897 RepID=UPI00272B5EF1|nr:ATP synthase subunit I [Coxiella-like endosymbiont]
MCQKSPSNKVTQSARVIAYRIVGLQAMIVVVIALGWWIKGAIENLSVLLGGMACLLPSLYFARRLFATTSPRVVKQSMVNFYLGEVIKLALSAGLVIVIILYIPVSIVPFIMGFVGAQFGFWLAPLVIKLDRV